MCLQSKCLFSCFFNHCGLESIFVIIATLQWWLIYKRLTALETFVRVCLIAQSRCLQTTPWFLRCAFRESYRPGFPNKDVRVTSINRSSVFPPSKPKGSEWWWEIEKITRCCYLPVTGNLVNAHVSPRLM